MSFRGRKHELELIEQSWSSDGPKLVVMRGKRGVGKTSLLQQFLGQDKRRCYFLASRTPIDENLRQFAETLVRCFPDCSLEPDDLATIPDMLQAVCQMANGGRIALVLDEVQYLLDGDASLALEIADWWKTVASTSGIFLVLCGSDEGTMRELAGESSPLSGCIDLDIHLEPMSFFDVAAFYAGTGYSAQDRIRAYGALGGMPKYHALFGPERSVEENIQQTILSPWGCLHNEPEFLLLASGVRDPAPYNAVLRAIAEGYTRSSAICDRLGIKSNRLSFYIESLMEMGWVSKEYPFDEASEKRAVYSIKDEFLRFWYSFVAGHRSELELGETQATYDERIRPHLDGYMRRVFVDIGHRYLQHENARDVLKQTVLRSGRWWNRDGSQEIDMVAELADGSYLIGECVWTSMPTGIDVYYKLKDKASRLLCPEYSENASYLIVCSAGRKDELKQAAGKGLYVVYGGD